MRLIKRLNWFVLKSFLPLFAMTFFIVLFIVLMQFLWRYIDDLVGKGLGMGVLGELFFYAAVTMVPMALPLAILLASLMTFGNLGEKSELTAIKASGISLIKTMRPLIILIMVIAVGAFFFQNYVLPIAQVKMYTLLFSMKQKSPEVEIPEGVFYDQIPGYNLFIKSKNQETGVLYDAMIYDISKGGDNATILLADSARLAFTKDMRYLYLHLFTGEEFENLREQRQLDRNVPFRRESFFDKEILIPFDANFNRMDEGGMRRQYVGKNIAELNQTIDSINLRLDSIGTSYSYEFKRSAFSRLVTQNYFDKPIADTKVKTQPATGSVFHPAPTDPEANFDQEVEVVTENKTILNVDSLIKALTPADQDFLYSQARSINRNRQQEIEFQSMIVSEDKRSIRRHDMELIKKFTLSVACIIFFFIGAPLGAIIRKGGLGAPLVISVLLFVVYYIIDNTGTKMARDGHIPVWEGMWLSTFVLLPLGIFVTYKAMNDSAVFNKDLYLNLIRKVFGLSESRHVPLKEVIISEVDVRKGEEMLARCYALSSCRLLHSATPQSYWKYWNSPIDSGALLSLGEYVDETVGYLSDSRNLRLLMHLEKMPVIKKLWIYDPIPANMKKLRKGIAIFFPIGGIIYLLSLPYQRILHRQVKRIQSESLSALIALA